MIPPDNNPDRLANEVKQAWLRLQRACQHLGIEIKLVEGWRSPERQAELYAQGRTTPGPIVTHAPPGQGPHEGDPWGQGWAIDFCFGGTRPYDEDHPWDLVGHAAEHLDFDWGGAWSSKKKDRPHLQMARSNEPPEASIS